MHAFVDSNRLSNGVVCVVGINYYLGRGVPQNYIEAFKWLLKAAGQGHSTSKKNIGNS